MRLRKPNYKKRIKARTTGRAKRAAKKAVIPGYGKRGSGLIKDPKRAVYNKAYNKTTMSADEAAGGCIGCLIIPIVIIGIAMLIF